MQQMCHEFVKKKFKYYFALMNPFPSSLGLQQVPDKYLLRMEIDFPCLLRIPFPHL